MNSERKTIRVGLAVGSFSGGGAERVMITLANKFYEWGYSVDFIVGLDEGPYRSQLNSAINKVVLANSNLSRIAKRCSALFIFCRYLKKSNPTVLMSTIREFNVFTSFAVYLFGAETKHVVREADTLDRLFFSPGLKNKLLLKLMRFFYPKAHKIIANCNVTKQDLVARLDLTEKSIHVIYNPLDLDLINQLSQFEKNNLQKKIIACGRLDIKKNFDDLIRAVPIVKKKYPDIKLEILGQGIEKEKLAHLINELMLTDSVTLLGFVDNPFKYFVTADVFVQTSLWEGFGYVLAEAMACGIPVVAYDSKGAMREILANGKYGLLTPVGDLNSLANAIIHQIENPTKKELLKEAVERFNIDTIAKRYLNVLGIE
jgi:glycosyltransferase involved in cell wall biosynthesis